jgi:signal transduction histidine kinase/CheY-like chemotaxis protein
MRGMEAAKRTSPCRPDVLVLGLIVFTGASFTVQAEPMRGPAYSLAEFQCLQGLVVRAAVQDSRGYIWLGTDDGLWRWDSGGFGRLDLDSRITPPVRCFLERSDGTLWIGTQEGLVALDIVTLEFRTGTPLLPGTRIDVLTDDPGGRAWVGSTRGLYRLDDAGPSATATLVGGTAQHAIFALLTDDANEILAGTYGAVLRVTGGRIVKEHAAAVGAGVVEALLRDADGALWVGVRNPGALFRVRGDQVREFGVLDRLGNPEVNVLAHHPDGDIWIGTEDGVYRFANGRFHGALCRDNGLRNTDVHALMVDFERQVWIGTYGGGIYRLRSPYVQTYSVEHGLAHPFVTAVAWATDGRLVFGTIRGAQALLPDGARVESLRTNTNITAAYVDRRGETWIGDYYGVTRTGDGARFPVSRVYRLAEDDAGRLLVAAQNGVWRLEREQLRPLVAPATVSAPVQDVRVQSNGVLLLATEDGLVRVHGDSSELVLPGCDVRVVREGADGRLRLGTPHGVVVCDAAFETSNGCQELPLNCNVRDVVQVADGDVWLATDIGVVRLRDEHVDRFGPEYGLPSPDVRSLAYDGAGALYAGTTQGLVRINVAGLRPCLAPPRVAIRELTAGSESFGVHGRELSLPFRQRDVVVELEPLGWQSAVGARFAHRLLGRGDGWSPPNRQPTARYASLAPGTYQFQARSINERGSESEIATVAFSIQAPFWLTSWFVALLVGLGFGLAALALHAYRRRRQLRRSAEEAAQVKSEFVSRMSHEIRTPLTAILASAEMLCDRNAEPNRRNEHVRSIVRNGRHLLALTNDVLDLSKLNEGRMEPDLSPTDLDSLLDEVRTVARHRALGKPITVVVEAMPDVPRYIVTDATKLRQILFNLMDNAVRFTREGAVRLEVTIPDRASAGRPVLHFAVTDTGIGIRLEERESVFQAFRQADSSIRRRYGGTGLGLTIAKSLAELLGGRLTMASLAGTGTTFTLELPVDICDGVPPLEQRSAPFGGVRLDGLTVLLADDSEDTRRVLRLVLEQLGARVVCASGGNQAVECAADRPFDVILLDIHMPETDGIETLRRLHERSIDTPAIAVTADASSTTASRCLEAGFDAFITKPFDAAGLAETICTATGRRVRSDPHPPRTGRRAPDRDELTIALSDRGPIESTIASISPALADAAAEFATALADDVRALDAALSRRDLAAIAEIAHRLKGSGGTNGYPAVSDASADLEAALAAQDSAKVAVQIRRLDLLQRRMIAGIHAGQPQSP